MKIIAINRFYAPDHSATSQLLTHLCEHLADQGDTVHVITSRLNYDDHRAAPPAHETINNVRIHRIWTSRFGRFALAGRAIDCLTFHLIAFFALLRLAQSGDTIIAKTDPPLISVTAALIARLKGADLINWCQDLFPEIAAALGVRIAKTPLGTTLRHLRNWSLHQARCNIVLCDAMQKHLETQGIEPTRIQIIPNWCPTAIEPLPRHRRTYDPLLITYSGNLGRAHLVDDLIELIASSHELPIQWRFVGGGVGWAKLQHAVQTRSLSHVSFEPYAPADKLSQSLAHADYHLITLDPLCEGLIMPSKLYGIQAAKRPVLFLGAKDGAIAQHLRQSQSGISIDVEQSTHFRHELQRLIEHFHDTTHHTVDQATAPQSLAPDSHHNDDAIQYWTEEIRASARGGARVDVAA